MIKNISNITPIVYPWLESDYLYFKNLYNQKKLPNVILLHGVDGIGKSSFAASLALLFDDSELNNTNILGSDDKITIDSIREVINSSSKTGLYGSKNIYILLGVDKINESSANALLKVLESELGSSLFIMTAENYNLVKPTVLSRAFKYNLYSKNNDDIYKWLDLQTKMTIEQKQELLEYTNNAPLHVVSAYKNGHVNDLLAIKKILTSLTCQNIKSNADKLISICTDKIDNKKSFNYTKFFNMLSYCLLKAISDKPEDRYRSAYRYLINSYKKEYNGVTIDNNNLIYNFLYKLTAVTNGKL